MEDYKQKHELGSIVTAKRTYNGEIITGEFCGFRLFNKSNPKSIVGVVLTPDRPYDVEPNSIESVISQDERIKNGIIQYLEQSQFGEEHYQIDDDIVRGYIAWLEKQGLQKTVEPVTVVERDGERWVRVRALGEDFIIAAHDYREGNKTNFSWEEACKIGTFSIKQAYITLALKDEINAKLKEIGGEPLDSYYWSSSEYNSLNAWYVYFSSGYVNSSNKYNSNVARAVAAF